MTEVVCAGIVVVDHIVAPMARLPAAGELALVDDCFLALGGCAANVAANLRRQDVEVAVAGAVGDDAFGRLATEWLSATGADVSTIAVAPGYATSQSVILNVHGEDRRFIHLRGANTAFGPNHLPTAALRHAKVFYFGGFFLAGMSGAALAIAFAAARANGCRTVLDVVTPANGGAGLDELRPALAHTDLFLPNADEGAALLGLHDPVAQARAFRALGANTVAITLGGSGVVVAEAEAVWRADAFQTTCVDGTGGGDAFAAGCIVGMLQGLDTIGYVRLGAALGASCVRQSGATAGVFTRAEAEAFVRQHPFAKKSA